MKRQVCIIFLLLIMIFPTVSFAAETSSDTMILEWKTYKVWKDGENLCMSGEFENLRNDLKIARLNNFTAIITWSLGNESGYGKNFETLYNWTKSFYE